MLRTENTKNLKRKRDEWQSHADSTPEDQALLPLIPDAMFLVVSELGAADCTNVSLVNSQFGTIFNHNSAWKRRFEKHFPHRKASRIDQQGWHYIADYKQAVLEEYNAIDVRIKKILYAVKERDLAAIEALNVSFSDLYQEDAVGKTVFEWMVTSDYQPVLDYIYCVICQHYVDQSETRVIDPDYVDDYGYTRLHRAVLCSQSLTHLEELISFQGFDVNATTNVGYTPLMIAAGIGKASVLKLLINLGANVHLADDEGKTAIHLASSNNNVEAIKCLVAAKADVNQAPPDNNQTPLWTAARHGHTACVQVLLSNQASSAIHYLEKTPLYMAAKNGHADCVQEILNKDKSTIDYVTVNDRTALFAAAKNGDVDCVRHLMSAGANWAIYDINGETPLLVAARHGHDQVVRLMTAYGADIDQIIDEEEGMSALMWAVSQEKIDPEMIHILLDNDADPNFQMAQSKATPLHMAIIGGCMETIQMLIEANADPELELNISKKQLIHLLRSTDENLYRYSINEVEQSEQQQYSLSVYELAMYFHRYEANEFIRYTLHPPVFGI